MSAIEAPELPVLVVDDDAGQRSLLRTFLESQGFTVLSAPSGSAALDILRERSVALVISDVRMPGISGMDLLRTVRAEFSELPVLLVTAYAEVRDAVDAVRGGAVDYIEKPIDFDELLASAVRALRIAPKQPATGLGGKTLPPEVVSASAAMKALFEKVAIVADSDARILITGESGVGKEVVADLLHAWSPRAARRFVKVNCAAIPESLLESELFGHERGAFTGAVSARAGQFEAAEGGTLLLDEIGELPQSLQAKLLRVTQDGSFHRVGSNTERNTDVRVLAATNRDLEADVAEKRFREDLFYRLNVVELYVPSLKERPEDILPLAQAFAHQLSDGQPRFSETASVCLGAYQWPGNVRELRNVIEYALLMARGDVILPEHLPARLHGGTPRMETDAPPAGAKMEEIERAAMMRALRAHGNNRTRAASVLGISRRTLTNKIRKWREQGFEI